MFRKPIIATLLMLGAIQAYAATVVLSGTNFDVSYDNTTLGNYGTPTLSGNVIFFTPTNFKAESLNGNGYFTESGTINLRIMPKNGFVVGNLNLQERGDYVLRGTGSFVGVSGQTRAFSLSNPLFDISNPIVSSSNMSLATGTQQNWVASSSLQLSALNIQPDQQVNYTIENLLEAYTESLATGPRRAFIEKKFSGFSVTVSPVPEPATYLSLLAGLGFVVAVIGKQKGIRS